MINLDDPETYAKLDPGNMFGRIADLPDQCRAGWALGQGLELPFDFRQVNLVAIAGMGGSAIGGALLASLIASECRVPILVVRDYDLPACAAGPGTLVIGSSYSGNTEEVLAAFAQGHARGCQLMAIATGGRLARLAAEYGAPLLRYDYPACPRATLGYSLAPLLAVIGKLGLARDYAPDMEEAISVMRTWQAEIEPGVPAARNDAKRLAGQLVGRCGVIWGSGVLAEAARRFKGQLNENAKAWAFFEVLPEADHNAIEGVQFPKDVLDRLFVLFLSSSLDHPRVQRRCALSRQSLQLAGIDTGVLAARGQPALAHMLGVIHFTDYVSGYLALLQAADPSAMEAITALKRRMADVDA